MNDPHEPPLRVAQGPDDHQHLPAGAAPGHDIGEHQTGSGIIAQLAEIRPVGNVYPLDILVVRRIEGVAIGVMHTVAGHFLHVEQVGVEIGIDVSRITRNRFLVQRRQRNFNRQHPQIRIGAAQGRLKSRLQDRGEVARAVFGGSDLVLVTQPELISQKQQQDQNGPSQLAAGNPAA
jgi:hypothetical protein